jgi:hypothetical protein
VVTVEDQFANFPKANPIVATTYNLEYAVVKNVICPKAGVHERSIILTDASCFSEAGTGKDFFNQGLTHYVYPASNVSGAFHPKVAIGVDEGLVRLLVGSHNLTEYGTQYNLEITGFYEISLTEENSKILNEISSFLQGLASRITSDLTAKKSILQLSNHIKDIHPMSMKLKTDEEFYFLHSFKIPILSQVMEIIPRIEGATICVPTHSEDENFIKETARLLSGKLKFLVDPKNFSVNEKAKQIYEKFKMEGLEIEEGRNLHAKIYILHTKKGDWTLYGSPNFTRPALTKSVDKGGNAEAAILIAPSKKWNWKKLFEETVTTTPLSWQELQPSEETAEEETPATRLVENWGYETPNNEAVVFAPGLQNGDVVYIRLFGLGKLIEVKVKGGFLRFNVPADWTSDSRYEVLDSKMNVIITGFLNRSGAAMRELAEIDMNDESKIRLWFFMNRLRNFKPHKYDKFDFEIPLIPLDPGSWIDVQRRNTWAPVSSRLANLTPDQIFNSAKNNFEEVWDKYYERKSKIPITSRLRLVLIALDIYMEGAFYAHIISGGSSKYFVQLGKDLCEFFSLPCAEDCRALWNEETWRTEYFEELNEDLLEVWDKIGSIIRLDISLLFDFWLYFNSQTVGGFRAFEKRSLDVPINVNRFYQILQALRKLTVHRRQDASFQKVWDDRVIFLESQKGFQKPSDLKSLEKFIENCNRQAAVML